MGPPTQALLRQENDAFAQMVDQLRSDGRAANAQLGRLTGDNAELDVELITPIAMEERLRFAIREGGRTVGSGVVTRIIE